MYFYLIFPHFSIICFFQFQQLRTPNVHNAFQLMMCRSILDLIYSLPIGACTSIGIPPYITHSTTIQTYNGAERVVLMAAPHTTDTASSGGIQMI